MSRGARTWLLFAAVIGVVAASLFLLRPDTRSFRIPAESMVPTIEVGERIRVNEDAYEAEDPERGDLVVAHPPEGAIDGELCGGPSGPDTLCAEPAGGPAEVLFVERVVAVPGDRLAVRGGRAIVDGKPLDEPYAADCLSADGCDFRRPIEVPADHYFLMGDNRGASDDSRFWGPVPRSSIVGRVDDCWPLGLRCSERDEAG